MNSDTRQVAITRIVTLAALAGLFLFAVYEAQSFRSMSRSMPIFVGSVGLVASLLLLAREILRWRVKAADGSEQTFAEPDPNDAFASAPIKSASVYWAWFGGYVVLIVLLGFRISTFLFVTAFLINRDKMAWPLAALLALATVGLMVVAEVTYGIRMPQSVLW